jgi:hypothetical protein
MDIDYDKLIRQAQGATTVDELREVMLAMLYEMQRAEEHEYLDGMYPDSH